MAGRGTKWREDAVPFYNYYDVVVVVVVLSGFLVPSPPLLRTPRFLSLGESW